MHLASTPTITAADIKFSWSDDTVTIEAVKSKDERGNISGYFRITDAQGSAIWELFETGTQKTVQSGFWHWLKSKLWFR
jgi:hypothetical protein